MQKLKTKLKTEWESCWWLWIPEVLRPRWQKEAQEEFKKNPDFQFRKDLLDKRGVLKLSKDGKEPHPGSITNKHVTVSDRKGNQVKSPVVYSAKGKCVCVRVDIPIFGS